MAFAAVGILVVGATVANTVARSSENVYRRRPESNLSSTSSELEYTVGSPKLIVNFLVALVETAANEQTQGSKNHPAVAIMKIGGKTLILEDSLLLNKFDLARRWKTELQDSGLSQFASNLIL